MKHYKIEIDVLEVVHDFYPGLSVEDASKIADSIVDAWDYTHDFDSINDDISWYAAVSYTHLTLPTILRV